MIDEENDIEESLETLQKRFFRNAAWYTSQKDAPTGVYTSIGKISKELEVLNKNLEASSQSSVKLSRALHVLTLVGTILAAITLGFEIYKYIYPN